ncbi:RluA family pseudouridine synthase [Maribacter confluentis]|uniref:RluA family pseudouridine synthase n=1 Tax=Maribacter confluentis TaxID=1656093 RepID=A0ABT8RU02_9FLAO|nr:RluA family pseudouridine synthase [Maribacter confluentis]MDO1514416.1 RluA family pseudouridine synthase [Maribacter confluentis]
MHIRETHFVAKNIHKSRLQEYGVGIFEGITSKSALKKAIKKKLIWVNGKEAFTATFISGGEKIEYLVDTQTPSKRLKLPLQVIFEDEYLAVINKPAGILVSGNKFLTIANALPQNLKISRAKDAVDPQPVHRLDYETTGLLLVGKTNSAIVALNQMFKNRAIKKTYLAVTIGEMRENGHISLPIDNKVASSSFSVIQSTLSDRFTYLNLVELQPQTGRRHQLRKHLYAIGNPILGDKLYFKDNLQLRGKGLYLHAYSLQFQHPISNNTMNFKAILPKKFYNIFPEFEL